MRDDDRGDILRRKSPRLELQVQFLLRVEMHRSDGPVEALGEPAGRLAEMPRVTGVVEHEALPGMSDQADKGGNSIVFHRPPRIATHSGWLQ